jgi:shikimate 5-dehydrogenase
MILIYPFISLQDRARDLADTVGGNALSLADLANFNPEDGMILANTTAIGMQPKVDETPIPKVCLSAMLFPLCVVIS